MDQPCYRTLSDFMSAREQKQKTIKILNACREAILMLNVKMPDFWHESHGDNIKMELVCEVEKLIGELKNESR